MRPSVGAGVQGQLAGPGLLSDLLCLFPRCLQLTGTLYKLASLQGMLEPYGILEVRQEDASALPLCCKVLACFTTGPHLSAECHLVLMPAQEQHSTSNGYLYVGCRSLAREEWRYHGTRESTQNS